MKFKNWKPFLKFFRNATVLFCWGAIILRICYLSRFSHCRFHVAGSRKTLVTSANATAPCHAPHSPCDLATICKPVGSSSPFLLSYLPLSHLPAFFTFFPRVHVFAFCFCICAEIKLHRRTIQLEWMQKNSENKSENGGRGWTKAPIQLVE